MANELGKGYISIEPDAKGFGPKVERSVIGELGGVGDKAGKKLGSDLGDGAATGLKGKAASFGAAADSALAPFGVSMKQAVAVGVAGAGVAIGAFAVKAAEQFQSTALAAGKLSEATGLAVDDASRWMEVGNDLGVSTERLGTAFGFLLKSIGKNPDAFRELGITAEDANGQILQAIDLLNRTPAGAERAALGVKLFGRGWAEMSELIAVGADGLQASLAKVSEAKVISPEELENARRFREVLENLRDVVEDFTMTIGQLVVEGLGPTIASIADLTAHVNELMASLPGGGSGIASFLDFAPIIGGVDGFSLALDGSANNLDRLKGVATGFAPILEALPFMQTASASDQAAEAARKHAEQMMAQGQWASQAAVHLDIYNQQAMAATAANTSAAAATQSFTTAMNSLFNAILAVSNSNIAFAQSGLAVSAALDAEKTAAQNAASATDNTATAVNEADAASRAYKSAVLNTQQAINSYGAQALKTAAEQRGLSVEQLTAAERSSILRSALNNLAAANPPLQSAIQGTISKLDSFDGKNAKATMGVDDQASGPAARINAALDNAARNRTSTIHVITRQTAVGVGTGLAAGGAAGGAIIPGPYSQASPGWTLHGSEVVMNPMQQAKVLMAIAEGDRTGLGGGSDQPVPQQRPIEVPVYLDSKEIARAIYDPLRAVTRERT